MRFLIVRTDIRAAEADEVAAAWAAGGRLRDEEADPEARRQIVHADDRDAAFVLARALSSMGAVRAGRQRVKVLPLTEPDRFHHPPRQPQGLQASRPARASASGPDAPRVPDHRR
jgi:hypothetical protein